MAVLLLLVLAVLLLVLAVLLLRLFMLKISWWAALALATVWLVERIHPASAGSVPSGGAAS
ncbi:MAG: hypothetical protein ACXVES_09205 [Actinomycetota bacterium]